MPTLTLTQADNNRSFDVQTGDTIVILLEESPTTGYRWAIDQADQQILRLQNSDFSLAAGGGVGGGGQRTFTFIAQKPGATRVSLKLWRDWEGNNSITSRVDVAINVK